MAKAKSSKNRRKRARKRMPRRLAGIKKKVEQGLLPSTLQNWLDEIATGYHEAKKTIPFAKLADHEMGEKDLFQIAPLICLKYRRLPRTERFEKRATEAAFSSYVATESNNPEALSDPYISFALAYLASHYGLDLITENQVVEIMDFVAQEQTLLMEKIARLGST
jgi:hypothetical protein